MMPLPGIGFAIDDFPANVQRFDARELDRSHEVTAAEFLDRNAGSVTSGAASDNPSRPT
ncbi:MAG: hypothetical protein M3Z31_13065 [Pseudomonadota bacterium]|nr:hypothetical protein [Pseudomonadota bacterium]